MQIHKRFGESIRQKRIQKYRTQDGLQYKRNDVKLHATSRPWHSSSAGIRMNVNALGQIAREAGPVAQKYLNRMSLSEIAQRKRGLGHDPGNYDKIGAAMLASIKNSSSRRFASSAPGKDKILAYMNSIGGGKDMTATFKKMLAGSEYPKSKYEGHYGRTLRSISGGKKRKYKASRWK